MPAGYKKGQPDHQLYQIILPAASLQQLRPTSLHQHQSSILLHHEAPHQPHHRSPGPPCPNLRQLPRPGQHNNPLSSVSSSLQLRPPQRTLAATTHRIRWPTNRRSRRHLTRPLGRIPQRGSVYSSQNHPKPALRSRSSKPSPSCQQDIHIHPLGVLLQECNQG